MLCFSVLSPAQGKFGPDSAECVKYLSYYKEYYKQKSYESALPYWRLSLKYCPPTVRETLLTDGTTLVRQLIGKNARNAEYRAALVDTLLMLHDLRAANWPKSKVTAYNNKGTDVNNYIKNDDARVFSLLNEVIENNKEKTSASILMFDLNAAIALYKGDKLGAEDVIQTYQRNIAFVEKAPAKNEAEAEKNAKIKADMEGLFIGSKVASCENLIALFTPRFEADPTNVELATSIVSMMSGADECTNNELFLKAATTIHRMQPSFKSAYFLYRLNYSKDNIAEAASFMEEAIASPDIDEATLARYSYEYANFCIRNNRPSKAIAAAQKAASLDPEYAGKSYQIIANVWAQANCSGDEIQRRAKYWVAVDYMQKAIAADPSIADDCYKAIAMYRQYYPQTAEAFMYDLTDGQSYSISCGGLSATTTVRTQK